MMGAQGASAEDTVETSGIRDALADAHKEWSVEVEEVSGQTLIEAEREEFHPNGSTATALALDHPKKPGWEVLAPGNSKDRWEATYESGIVAAGVLADLTHIFEARRTVKHERSGTQARRTYYKVETAFLNELKQRE